MWDFQSRNQDEYLLWTHPSGAEMEQVCDSSAAEQIILWLTHIVVMRNFWRPNVYLYQLAKKSWQWNGSIRPLDSPFKFNVKRKKKKKKSLSFYSCLAAEVLV